MTAIDPAEWLDRFTEVGGCYSISDERIVVFVRDAGNPHFMRAKSMWNDLDDDELREAVKELVRERCLIRNGCTSD